MGSRVRVFCEGGGHTRGSSVPKAEGQLLQENVPNSKPVKMSKECEAILNPTARARGWELLLLLHSTLEELGCNL